jgi:alcohol dehydrogenase (NADP+)
MRTVQLNDGDEMPILGLGTWKSEEGDVYKAVKEALRIGYRHIDCAPIYGNEGEIGQALSESIDEGVVTRGELWITSKLWNSFHAVEDVRPALEQTLGDLQLDYLDLYLIHWPVALKKGVYLPKTGTEIIALDGLPIADTWGAMESLLDRGLCRHIGVCNFSTVKLKALLDSARINPEMNQIELHPYLQQNEMLAFCKQHGVHLTAYSPLGSPDRPAGLKAEDEPILLQDSVICGIALRHDISPALVLLSWAINRGTCVIPKSVNPERMKQNLSAVEVSLSPEEMQAIAKLDLRRRYLDGSFWALDGSPFTLASLWDE